MKKSSRDRRVFRRLQRRSMSSELMTEHLTYFMAETASTAIFGNISLSELQEAVRNLC